MWRRTRGTRAHWFISDANQSLCGGKPRAAITDLPYDEATDRVDRCAQCQRLLWEQAERSKAGPKRQGSNPGKFYPARKATG
jgi:hypothetical protein